MIYFLPLSFDQALLLLLWMSAYPLTNVLPRHF